MEPLLQKFNEDPKFMLAVAVAVVVLLFVTLVVIVAAMRVRSYRDRFENLRIENAETNKRLEAVRTQLNDVSLKNAGYIQELKHFGDVKERLMAKEKEAKTLQETLSEVQSRLSQTQAQLEATKEQLQTLHEEFAQLKERYDKMVEENNKLRINNARLLTKLESESRMGKRA